MLTCGDPSCAANCMPMSKPLYPNICSASPKIGYVNLGENSSTDRSPSLSGWTRDSLMASFAETDPVRIRRETCSDCRVAYIHRQLTP